MPLKHCCAARHSTVSGGGSERYIGNGGHWDNTVKVEVVSVDRKRKQKAGGDGCCRYQRKEAFRTGSMWPSLGRCSVHLLMLDRKSGLSAPCRTRSESLSKDL